MAIPYHDQNSPMGPVTEASQKCRINRRSKEHLFTARERVASCCGFDAEFGDWLSSRGWAQ